MSRAAQDPPLGRARYLDTCLLIHRPWKPPRFHVFRQIVVGSFQFSVPQVWHSAWDDPGASPGIVLLNHLERHCPGRKSRPQGVVAPNHRCTSVLQRGSEQCAGFDGQYRHEVPLREQNLGSRDCREHTHHTHHTRLMQRTDACTLGFSVTTGVTGAQTTKALDR